MEAVVEEKGDVVIVRIEGRLDAASSPQLEKKLNAVIDTAHFKIVLNFAGVDYLSSAGMRLMLSVSKRLKSLEGKVIACCLSDEVMEVVQMAGFHQILDICPTEEASLAEI